MRIIIVLFLFLASVTSYVVYSENFDVPISGWVKQTLNSQALGGWLQGTTTERSSGGFTIPARGGKVIAVNDDKCGDCNGEGDYLTSPIIAIPTEPMVALSFDVFYNGMNAQMITVEFYTGAHTYNLIQPITPSNVWQTYRYPMFQFGGSDVQFKFFSFSDENFISSGVALDNFLVEAFASDVETKLNWDFESGTLPTGWTKTSDDSSNGWLIGTSAERSSLYCVFPEEPQIGSLFIATNDDLCACMSEFDYMYSNIITVPSDLVYGFLNYEYFFIPFTHSFFLSISVDGSAYTEVYRAPEVADSIMWEPFYFDMVPYAGHNVQFRFWSTDQNYEYSGCVGVDNIKITFYPVIAPAVTTSQISSSAVTSAQITSASVTSAALTTGSLGSCATWEWAGKSSGYIGYFCADDGSFWMCLSGAFASQSRQLQCATGTHCRCANGVECSGGGSPCTF
jgi:hypothetical protein